MYYLPVDLLYKQLLKFIEGLTQDELQIQLDQAYSKLMA